MNDIKVNSISKAFQENGEDLQVIDDISFAVGNGEFVSLIGPNGCGKTTLLKIIAGFVPEFNGKVTLSKPSDLSFGCAFIFQNHALFDWMTVEENILFPVKQKGGMAKKDSKAANEFISLLGLEGFENYYPSTLSGGMKQKVAIARALASNEKIILADEPFSSLDQPTKELLQEELQAIIHDSKKTVLFVTHDIDEAIYLSDRIILLSKRPARIIDEITVDLPRPRIPEIRNTPGFFELKARIWHFLREQSNFKKNEKNWRLKKWN